jgi:hypothetical protein
VTSTAPLDLAEITGRPTTAALLTMAAAIITGKAVTAITTKAPAHMRALFPDMSAGDLDRVALLVGWAQYVQHTATTCELSRKWRIARTIGAAADDTLDFALAAAAELAEQRFTAWALDVPIGAAAASTDRFMTALAERIAQRVVAHLQTEEVAREQNA